MRLIVLSKTHELLLLANRLGTARQHSSCALYLSDNDVFSGLSLKRIPRSRGNLETPERPFLYDVICNWRGRQVQTCIAIGDGGARRVRTDDLMLAKHALYQLSYGPFLGSTQESCLSIRSAATQELVGPGRFELPTLRLSGVRSNQLSYGPPWSPTALP